MSKLVNPVAVAPDELKPGDVMASVVTLHVILRGEERVFRMYRCAYPPNVYEGIPQGSRIGVHEREVAQELFPVIIWAGIEPDLL